MDGPTPQRQPKLDEREEHFFLRDPSAGPRLFLRYLASLSAPIGRRRPLLYVHGATFPSALSIAYRFGDRSWRDALVDAGFDVWGLDFSGFGGSDPYREMSEAPDAHSPLGLAEAAELQLERAIRFILEHQDLTAISLIAHSWGGMVAGRFAGAHPAHIDRMVLFAPISRRKPSRYSTRPDGPAWRIISLEDQWNRFVEDVPAGESPVLSLRDFDDWGVRSLETDTDSRTRTPAGVKVPAGPFVEILRAWAGDLAYDPGAIHSPVAIIRGAWDSLCSDADARWLFDALANAPIKRDIKIGGGTHVMHLEAMRLALWRESICFLLGDDVSAISE